LRKVLLVLGCLVVTSGVNPSHAEFRSCTENKNESRTLLEYYYSYKKDASKADLEGFIDIKESLLQLAEDTLNESVALATHYIAFCKD